MYIPLQDNRKTVINCEAPIHDRRTVKSSSGSSEKRYVIKTSIAMGEQSWDIELTLTNRDAMGYRMLLGREAMKGRLLVDPEESFMFGEPGGQRATGPIPAKETRLSAV